MKEQLIRAIFIQMVWVGVSIGIQQLRWTLVQLSLQPSQIQYTQELMKIQKSMQLKKEKRPLFSDSPSMELLPISFPNDSRRLSLDAFKDFQRSLSKSKLASKSASLKKFIKDGGNLIHLKHFQSQIPGSRIEGIDGRLKQKFLMDQQVEYNFGRQLKQHDNKKCFLEKKIGEIRMRNCVRIRQIQQFQERVVEKYKAEYSKDKEEFNKLSEAYSRILEQEKLLELSHVYRKQKVTQDRQKILEEQKRFINFINNLRNNDAALAIQHSEVLARYEPSKKHQETHSEKPTQISDSVSKPSNSTNGANEKPNSKQVDRSYLEQNKRVSLKNKRARQLNSVNLKSIDYNSEIKSRLQKNQKVLSLSPSKALDQRISYKSQAPNQVLEERNLRD